MPSPGLPAASRSVRASRSWPVCSSRRATRAWCSPPSTTRPRPAPRSSAEVSDEGRALVSGRLLADICRSLPGQAGRDGARRRPRLADLRLGPVQPADDAGRGLPDAARHAGRDRHRRRARASPTPSPRRSPPPAATTCCPVLTGVRIEIDGSTISLLATDRFRLSHRELDWNPRTPDESAGRAGPGARSSATPPSRSPPAARSPSRSPPPAPARASSASRATAPGGVAVRRPACSTASSPRSAACSRSEHLTTALVDKTALIESVKRVALVAERNTAVQLAFSDGVLTLDAGSGDEAQASESIEATIDGEDITTGLQPAVPARRPRPPSTSRSSSSPSPRPPSRSCISGSVGEGERGHRRSATC